MVALVPIALIIGFALGWYVRKRLNMHYKQLWLNATKLLEDKTLFDGSGDLGQATTGGALVTGTPGPKQVLGRQATGAGRGRDAASMQRPAPPEPHYIHGKWALDETHNGTTAVYRAVRLGFDPIELGNTPNYQRFGALYRRDRENAANAVEALNKK